MRNKFKQELKKLGVKASVKKAEHYGKGCFSVSDASGTMYGFAQGAQTIIKKLAIKHKYTTTGGYPINLELVAMDKFELAFRVA